MRESFVDASLRDVIDFRSSSAPDDIFLIDPLNGEMVTFGELQRAASSIAAFVAEQGIRQGDTISYAMPNGLDTVKVILGLIYGGYVATAINLVAGNNTIDYVIEHSESKLILCASMTRDLIGEQKTARVVEVSSSLFERRADPICAHKPTQHDIGLLMYTSGTTGKPKGVLLSHQNLVAGGLNALEAHDLGQEDRGLCVLPLYHINGFTVTMLGALLSGSSLIMPPKFSVGQFWSYLRDNKGTWFSVVPTQISYLLNESYQNGHDEDGLGQLRFGRSASAPLSPDVQNAFEKAFNIPVIETMGLTETSGQILSNPIDGPCKVGSPGIAYGNEVIVANANLEEALRGQVGEVLVRGPNVMQGYLHNIEATEAALTSEGWLRTGDLGRMDEDGYVTITGRLKELIIKGGENISPREVDDALYSHPDVIEAAAFARECVQYGQRVEAGVKLCEGSMLKPQDLIELCSQRIGAFKSPDQIHILPELPKGPSGKIQRGKLGELTT